MRVTCKQICIAFVCSAGLALSGGAATAQDRPEATQITSERDVKRLQTAQGISLQWIDWDRRGEVYIEHGPSGVWRINGLQRSDGGRLAVDGVITEIGEDYFLLDGRIVISGTPDEGRLCVADKIWRFEVTQARTYYRLREFEWCDGLTDYVDIYFSPRLRG